MRADVIVIGAGAVGSAALFHLARRGLAVIGLDQFDPPHDRGSSHGETRIWRQAYYESPAYVPLAQRALHLWRELEVSSGTTLFTRTGALTIGPDSGELFPGALRSAAHHGVAHEVLTRAQAASRFPAYRAPAGSSVVFEPGSGVLFPEACVAAHLAGARDRGAVVRTNIAVDRVDTRGPGVVVAAGSERYTARHLVIAAGAWTPAFVTAQQAFAVTRERIHWFRSPTRVAAAPACPVAMIEHSDGPILYTIPDFGSGFKAGLHRAGATAVPDLQTHEATDGENERIATIVSRYAPGGAGELLRSTTCYYTNTADHHFAIGRLPDAPAVVIASACSGHGFKFASAIGEALAALVAGDDPALPSIFDPARLGIVSLTGRT